MLFLGGQSVLDSECSRDLRRIHVQILFHERFGNFDMSLFG